MFVSGRDNVGRGGTIGLDPSLAIDVPESPVSRWIRVEIPKARVREMLERLGR